MNVLRPNQDRNVRSRFAISGIIFFMSVVSYSCSNSQLPDYYQLGKLRILALQASSPELNPPGTTVITPVITDLNGAGRTLPYRLEGCLDPGIELGVAATCDRDPQKTSRTGILALTAPHYTGPVTLTDGSIPIPIAALAGWSEAEKFNGVPYLIVFTLTPADGLPVIAYRRILTSTRTTLNANPTLTAIQVAGQDLASLPGTIQPLQPVVGAGSAETYFYQLASGAHITQVEQLTVDWFVSAGKMKFSRTDASSTDEWEPPAITPGVAPFLFGIIRDDRGGVGYLPGPVGP